MGLAGFILRRLLWTVPLTLGVMLGTFALMRGAGGSPFRPPEGYLAVPRPIELELRDFYNLDAPWAVEFLTYVKNVFTLRFGPSLLSRDVTVDDVMAASFPVTLELILLAAAGAVPLGIGLGLLAAVRRGSVADFLATATASIFLVVPVFFVAYVLSRYPVREWGLLPLGWAGWESKVLPALTLALGPTGYVARLVRGAVVETLHADYVRTARAKGLGSRRILVVHVLRNSLGPFLSATMPMLALLVTGALFVEQFFGIPGAASVFVDAANTRDYPMLLGLTVALTALVLIANLVSDVLLAVLDPRLREAMRA